MGNAKSDVDGDLSRSSSACWNQRRSNNGEAQDVHPTSELDGTAIQDLYGGDVRLVHHEH
jgi:hypothetical protein